MRYYGADLLGLNAYERHKKFMDDYGRYYGKGNSVEGQKLPVKTDQDTLRESYRFIRTEEDDLDASWEQRLAKRYYDKLFKEYCIADMTHYKYGKIGLRWRAEKEVISGKGQFICGNKKCDERGDLSSYEVNFSYREAGEIKQALVKLRICPKCATKLNYRKEKEQAKAQKAEERENRKRRREEQHICKSKSYSREKELTLADMKVLNEQQGASRSSPAMITSELEGKLCTVAQGITVTSFFHFTIFNAGDDAVDPQPEGAREGGTDEEYSKYFKGLFL
eukprot:c24833_g1_i5 orf=269-1105(+)